MRGHPQADRAGRNHRRTHRRSQLRQHAGRMIVAADERHRAGPAAAGQPLGQPVHLRHVVERIVGAFDGQRQRSNARRPPLGDQQPSDRGFIERTGGQRIDRLGRHAR